MHTCLLADSYGSLMMLPFLLGFTENLGMTALVLNAAHG